MVVPEPERPRLTYRGYRAEYDFDSRNEEYVGRVAEIRDDVTFRATTIGDLEHELKNSVDAYLETRPARNEKPNRPRRR